MVGVNTIITDDPQLTARAGKDGGRTEKQPLRVVIDSRGRIPLDARVFQVPGKTLVAVTEEIEPAKSRALAEAGAEILSLPSKEGKVDLEALLSALGSKGIVNLLAEGGPTLFGSLFEQGLVDRALVFISPIIIGGEEASSPVKSIGVEMVTQAMPLNRVRVERFADDVLISAYMRQS
jgi:diaminohydroxyphosphoribosylaminopyrimidine deaminase/5-amino-6-(5-phosphoribosylamino)uracil reductase